MPVQMRRDDRQLQILTEAGEVLIPAPRQCTKCKWALHHAPWMHVVNSAPGWC